MNLEKRKIMKRWQTGAVAAALTLTVLSMGCAQKIDQTANTVVTTTVETEITTEATTAAPELTERAKKLLDQNPDTVGYIYIDGTEVDNPVVQTTDNEYYLDHGFDGEEFRAGTVFMDYRDVYGAETDTWSENIVLYGHNMADNTMFGSLRRYR
jgi:sortase B